MRTHAKLKNPRATPSGIKVNTGEKEREKQADNSGHYVLPAMPKGSARISLGPIDFIPNLKNPSKDCRLTLVSSFHQLNVGQS